METLTVFGEFLKPSIYAILFKTAMTSTWTGLSGRTHLWAQSQILSQPKRSREKKHPSLQVKSSTLCRKRKLLAQSWRKLLLTSNNRSIANCVQRPRLLYARAVRFTSAHLTQISRGSLNAVGPFQSSRLKRRPSLKRWARARALKHQHLNRSPSCLILTLCRSSVSVFTAPLEALTLSAPFTPSHLTLNELETREYCIHFQERKERLCGELSLYFPSPCHLQSSRALRSGRSTGSHIPPHQPQTAWLFSR